jgi:hypothetical protein
MGRYLLCVYITGDTLVHDELRDTPRLYPDIDLALIHLGGTQIMGVLLTIDAEQGVKALEIVRRTSPSPSTSTTTRCSGPRCGLQGAR